MRLSKGVDRCRSRNLPRDHVDRLVLEALAERVFTRKRVEIMLTELQKRLRAKRSVENAQLLELTRELDDVGIATQRLYEAVEKGLLPMDETLRARAQGLQARRQEILLAIAAKKDRASIALKHISPQRVATVCRALRERLLDVSSGFGKAYLNLLVDKIRLEGNELILRGSYDALARAAGLVGKNRKLDSVPSLVPEWRPHGDSNPGYRRERAMS